LGAERIARARCQHQIGRSVFTLGREQLPISAGSRNPRDVLMAHIDAGAPGSFQQQSIQGHARKDRDRVLHTKAYPLPRRTDQLVAFYGIASARGVRQKRILQQSFVGKAAAAGLFPCELLVKQKNFAATCRQQRASLSAR
jgi:hypothetical protein